LLSLFFPVEASAAARRGESPVFAWRSSADIEEGLFSPVHLVFLLEVGLYWWKSAFLMGPPGGQ